ncbi:MAG: UDP-N-acetylglucosamine 1-carboxyvinyltransferase [Acidimicrobiaceae bacterium]|nr:UDP-N-acetylglucosamine 1-carboxyvinyltransferase [Acidimicrobiaceae bacterium]
MQSHDRRDRLIVQSTDSLEGVIDISGAKNSVLKIMAATLLAEGEYKLHNVPRITDVDLMIELLCAVGCEVAWADTSPATLIITVPADINPVAPYEIVEKFRASIVLLGPMLGRCGEARVALPGGDDFGPRPIDMHLHGLKQMGAHIKVVHGNIEAATKGLFGVRTTLDFPSVGATENLLMAAVAAEGVTVIDNAAREPEISDLCKFLTAMGASINGVGSSTLEIQGTTAQHRALQATDHTVIPDRVEVATYLIALGITRGDLTITRARYGHIMLLVQKLSDMGMRIRSDGDSIRATSVGRLKSVDCATLPYPGLATDYKPFLVALLATASGVSIVTENLFAGRFRYIDELRRMGADIHTDSHHAVVRGVDRLSGAPVKAHDIRAGAALAVAGLGAKGTTMISDAHHIARGYEDIVGKLCGVGARISSD